MPRFVSIANHPTKGNVLDEKYVKTTYDTLSNNNVDLENIATMISQLPVREQKKFFRLFLTYTDITSNNKVTPAMREVVELSERIMALVNDYYEDQDQLAFEGM